MSQLPELNWPKQIHEEHPLSPPKVRCLLQNSWLKMGPMVHIPTSVCHELQWIYDNKTHRRLVMMIRFNLSLSSMLNLL